MKDILLRTCTLYLIRGNKVTKHNEITEICELTTESNCSQCSSPTDSELLARMAKGEIGEGGGLRSQFLSSPEMSSASHQHIIPPVEFRPLSKMLNENNMAASVGDIQLSTTKTEMSFPPGFENGVFPSDIAQTNNDYLFPSFMNTPPNTNTSFISENSFNSILSATTGVTQQEANTGFPLRNASHGILGSPFRSEKYSSGGVEGMDIQHDSTTPNFFEMSSTETNINGNNRWDFMDTSTFSGSASGGLGSKDFTDAMTSNYYSSPIKTSSGLTNRALNNLNNDLSFLDATPDSLDISKDSNTSSGIGGSGQGSSVFWDRSPSPSNSRDSNQVPFQHPWEPSIARLSVNECVQLIQLLSQALNESYQNGNVEDTSLTAQTLTLMNLVQTQMKKGLESQSSSQSPKTPVFPTSFSVHSNSSIDSPRLDSVDRVAKFHRDIAGSSDSSFTWSGQLPPRIHRNPTYSCKLFLGGVPFDITEGALLHAFKPFGNVKIEWPGKETTPSQPKGYLYVIFEHEKQVKLLLQNCFLDYSKSIAGDWYFKLTSRRFREKDVQVIPWAVSDSNYAKCPAAKIDAKKTIFVGALHGMLNAEGLAHIMDDLFGGVVYAGIDTDRHKYPIGSGRVTFNNMKSYMKAVSAAFVEIKTKFRKRVQVDPYLEDATCSVCDLQQGPYFCREWCCFRYFCYTCFHSQHSSDEFQKHRPLMRNANKPQGTPGAVTTVTFSPYRNRIDNNNRINNGNNNGGMGGYMYGNGTNHQQQQQVGPRRQDVGSRFPMMR